MAEQQNRIILDGYMSEIDIVRGIAVENKTGEYSMMVFEQDAIIEKHELIKHDFN